MISSMVFKLAILSEEIVSIESNSCSSFERISTLFMESIPRSDSRSMDGSSISTGKPVNSLIVFISTVETA